MSSLRYHINSHEKRGESIDQVSSISYDGAKGRRAIVKFIASTDQTLGIGSNHHFVQMVRDGFNAIYQPVSRPTATLDLMNLYEHDRKIYMATLASMPENNIACTSDIWNSSNKNDYLSVVIHYVDRDWYLHKKIIGFEHMNMRHTGKNISDRINEVLEEWGLVNRIVAITMDNAPANTTAITELKNHLGNHAG